MVHWDQVEAYLRRKYEYEAGKAIDATANPEVARGRAQMCKEFLNLRGAVETLAATEPTNG